MLADALIFGRGWVIGATENVDTEPKQKYILWLITKALEKPHKVIKFYEELKSRDIKSNTVIALKACTVVQHYIYNGSRTSIRPQQAPDLPLALLASLRAAWDSISGSHVADPSVSSISEKDA